MISENQPELLVPVQDWKTLKFLGSLPDAVYFGIQNFNMRKKANNFVLNDLRKIVDYCHSQDEPIRAYLCTNILIYNSELEELEKVIDEAKVANIDAIIAHDIAAINIARKYDMEFHISTQANISNIESARFYESLGAERLILARELSLRQIIAIKRELKRAEIETFVHGAMCTSISGRCYFSASITDSKLHSANRGNCIQPCRREWRIIDDSNNEFQYTSGLFLNSKDLCMIEYVPELIDAKIDAFKIEGRMKDPRYVKVVTECYKEAMSSCYENTFNEEKIHTWKKRLSEVYNRGFHTGFYFQKPNIEDIQLEIRGNASKWRKEIIGKVISYHKHSKTVKVFIENQNVILNKGELIFIENQDFFQQDNIKKIIVKENSVNSIRIEERSKPSEINIIINGKAQENDIISHYIKKKD